MLQETLLLSLLLSLLYYAMIIIIITSTLITLQSIPRPTRCSLLGRINDCVSNRVISCFIITSNTDHRIANPPRLAPATLDGNFSIENLQLHNVRWPSFHHETLISSPCIFDSSYINMIRIVITS